MLRERGSNMSEKKTIVYGLGEKFLENKDEILRKYNVVGFSDINEEKVQMYGGVAREHLVNHIDEYDEILVCANPLLIVPDLTGNLGIPHEKVKVYIYENMFLAHNLITFYGQRNEDAILLLVVSMLGLDCANLRYLEIGTNNPIISNNSYALYKSGARGVLVDAVPFFVPLIEAFRSEDIFIHAAITCDDGKEKNDFYLPIMLDGSCEFPIGSLDKKWMEGFKGVSDYAIIEVPSVNINVLLDRIGFQPELLLIDIEGYDWKVIKAIDFTRHKPKIIMAELGETNEEIRSFMTEKGYYTFTNVGKCNVIFVSQNAWDNRAKMN